jgi:hypothetical protein
MSVADNGISFQLTHASIDPLGVRVFLTWKRNIRVHPERPIHGQGFALKRCMPREDMITNSGLCMGKGIEQEAANSLFLNQYF